MPWITFPKNARFRSLVGIISQSNEGAAVRQRKTTITLSAPRSLCIDRMHIDSSLEARGQPLTNDAEWEMITRKVSRGVVEQKSDIIMWVRDRRSVVQRVRLTPSEHEILTTAAKAAGKTVSEFIRYIALKAASEKAKKPYVS